MTDVMELAVRNCYEMMGKFAVGQLVMFITIIILFIIIILLVRVIARERVKHDRYKSDTIEKFLKISEVVKNGTRRQGEVSEKRSPKTRKRDLSGGDTDASKVGEGQGDSSRDEKGSDNSRSRAKRKKAGRRDKS
jgi:uncharacterized membrane protein